MEGEASITIPFSDHLVGDYRRQAIHGGVISTLAYTVVVSFILLKITDALVGNRVNDDEELEGLDLVGHNERGYDL